MPPASRVSTEKAPECLRPPFPGPADLLSLLERLLDTDALSAVAQMQANGHEAR